MNSVTEAEFDREFARLDESGGGDEAATAGSPDEGGRTLSVLEAFDVYFEGSRRHGAAVYEAACDVLVSDEVARRSCDSLVAELAALTKSRHGLSEADARLQANAQAMKVLAEAGSYSDAESKLKDLRDVLIKEVRA